MSENVKYAQMCDAILTAAKKHGTADDVRTVQRVMNGAAEFIAGNGVSASSVAALESLGGDARPVLKRLDVADIGEDAIVDFVTQMKVPEARIPSTAVALARILQYGVDRSTIYSPGKVEAGDLSTLSVVGRGAANMIANDAVAATEAFGVTIDSLQQDNRLNIVLTLLRAFDSIIDKVLPRVSQENATITVKIPQAQVYDLSKSNDPSSAVRYGAANLMPLIQLYRNPSPVNTAAKNIIALTANDQSPSVLDTTNGNAILAGARVNMFDLALNANKLGYGNYDFTDLVAEGGRIDFLIINLTQTVAGSPPTLTTEQYKLPVSWLDQAKYSKPSNNLDSGDEIVTIQHGTAIRSTSKTATGAATALVTFTDAIVQVDVVFNSTLNLKTSDLFGSGFVKLSLKPAASNTSGVISGATTAAFAELSASIHSYQPDLQYNEENLRKTTTAVRVNRNSVQYNIPMSRNVVAEYSLTQVTDADVTHSINVVNNLGNTDRGLSIIESRLGDIASANAFAAANPEYASLVSPTKLSIAASVCLPIAVTQTLDYSDSKTLSMRETERLSDMHGRLRENLLSVLSQVCAESLYENCLDGGEMVVFKVITYSKIANMIFGIVDYHDALMDVVQKEGRSDYSFRLPNGYRIDVIKTNFDSFATKALVIPVRAAAPTDVTSFGTIRDCGSYVAGYNHINANGVESRTVTNTREIVFPTNPVGAILTIEGIDTLLNVSLNSTLPADAGDAPSVN